ncbi:hypothetical protein PM082_009473 [Marasmius tenuissimus]|nr:hypothetical protein PM082_009473 [Marasmius tenuissimus]
MKDRQVSSSSIRNKTTNGTLVPSWPLLIPLNGSDFLCPGKRTIVVPLTNAFVMASSGPALILPTRQGSIKARVHNPRQLPRLNGCERIMKYLSYFARARQFRDMLRTYLYHHLWALRNEFEQYLGSSVMGIH